MHSVSFKNAATSAPALLDDVQTPLAHPAETRATGLKEQLSEESVLLKDLLRRLRRAGVLVQIDNGIKF